MSQLISAVARVRALESELLTPSHLDRLITAKDFDEAYTVLDDLSWAEEAAYFRESKDSEGVMEVGMASSKEVFRSFQIPDQFSVLTVIWDIQNIKLALKSFIQNEQKETVYDLLLSYGSYSKSDILNAVFDNSSLSPLLPLLNKAKQCSSNNEMEDFLEKTFFERAFSTAKKDSFLLKYLHHAQRIVAFRKDALELSASDLVSKYPVYENLINLSLDENGEIDFAKIETGADEQMVNFLKMASMGKIDGYAPLFSYYWRKERNSRVIRSILLAKKAEQDIEQIKSDFITFVV